MPINAEISFRAADPHQPTLELLKQTPIGKGSFPNLQTTFSNESRTQSLFSFGECSAAGAASPGPRGSAHPGPRGHRGRVHPGRPRTGRLNLPPALAPPARRERRGGTGATGPSLGRGGARLAPGRSAGPETRAPALAPSCCPASRGAGAARPGAREQRPRPAVLRLGQLSAPPSARALRQRHARPTSMQVLHRNSSARLPGRELPQSMRFAGLGPPTRPERKTKSPASPGGRPGKCRWSASTGSS